MSTRLEIHSHDLGDLTFHMICTPTKASNELELDIRAAHVGAFRALVYSMCQVKGHAATIHSLSI